MVKTGLPDTSGPTAYNVPQITSADSDIKSGTHANTQEQGG